MSNKKFTIFTPVYNGEKYFHRVLKSVVNQTFKDFEWIIVDDGSTDNSVRLIKQEINKYPDLDVRLICQKNMGKALTTEKVLKIATGELFIPADQDDTFEKHTLAFFSDKWDSCDKLITSGISVLCKDENGKIVGDSFPNSGAHYSNFELDFKYKIVGEKWGCISTQVYKQINFPNHKQGYYQGSYWWYQVTKYRKALCFNVPLRTYYTNPSGMTETMRKGIPLYQVKNNMSYRVWLFKNYGFRILKYSPEQFLRRFMYYPMIDLLRMKIK